MRYWGSGHDWRKAEAKLNALPQFMTKIDGVDIHFIHVRSRHENALPIIISRIYWENQGRGLTSAVAQMSDQISIPVAVTVFPDEIYRAPESWARRAYRNLIYFNEAERGGHFAAWEYPELFAAELRAAFTSLRPSPRFNSKEGRSSK